MRGAQCNTAPRIFARAMMAKSANEMIFSVCSRLLFKLGKSMRSYELQGKKLHIF
jgi:hypothetical protein